MNRFRKTLTAEKLAEEYNTWNQEESKFGHMQRFGQRMVNKYLLEGETAPEIFYDADAKNVFGKIFFEIGN
jgi:hypothetical protein